ncbi:MAG TPA: VanZ family protein [Mycobacteriales bacterium]|nr:VanZ family protein [Mycobacteriales bacterium]
MTVAPARSWARTAAFLAAVVASAVALFTPEAPGPDLLDFRGADKVVHLGLFAVLAAATIWRFGREPRAVAALLGYAGASEVVQALWIEGRSGDVVDLVADVVGIALALSASREWGRRRAGSVASTPLHDEGDET